MSTNHTNSWEHQLQLLLDGELPAEQCSEFISRCTDDPKLWKVCSLAFIESQQFKNSFKEMLGTPSAKPISNMAVQLKSKSQVKHSTSAKIYQPLLWSIAMCVVFYTGWLSHSIGYQNTTQTVATIDKKPVPDEPLARPENSVATNQSPESQGTQQSILPQYVSLVNRSADGIYEQRFNLPVKETTPEEWADITHQLAIVPEELSKEYAAQGYELTSQPYYYKAGELEDGRTLVLPVTSYQLKPVSTVYYQ